MWVRGEKDPPMFLRILWAARYATAQWDKAIAHAQTIPISAVLFRLAVFDKAYEM